jgi:hypothetical protein
MRVIDGVLRAKPECGVVPVAVSKCACGDVSGAGT